MGIPPIAEELREVGLDNLELYIRQRHKILAQFITDQPIMDLFLEVERRPRSRVKKWWWDQDSLNLVESHWGG